MSDPLRVCRVCGVVSPTNYCERHQRVKTAAPDSRPSASARGYDRQWRAFRARYLKHHPLCVDCSQQGQTTPANEVHHVRKLATDRAGRFDVANLMALCEWHHKTRTMRGE